MNPEGHTSMSDELSLRVDHGHLAIGQCAEPSTDKQTKDSVLREVQIKGEPASFGTDTMIAVVVNTATDSSQPVSGDESDINEEHISSDGDSIAGDDHPFNKDASVAWAKCAKHVWKYEDETVRQWQDQINNWIIVSGLVSAALTGFVVQYYTSLQPSANNQAATNQAIMTLLSVHLSILAANTGQVDSALLGSLSTLVNSQVAAEDPAVIISESVNFLWISALVLSLGTASLAISVNQWLYSGATRSDTNARGSVRMWSFLYRSRVKWKVPVIISILPILLQASLTLFLVGLVRLLWTLNHGVAGGVMALVVVLLMVSICTPLIPAFITNCPYKSPQAQLWLLFVRWVSPHTYRPGEYLRDLSLWVYNRYRNEGNLAERVADKVSDYLITWCDPERWREWLKLTGWRDVDNFSARIQLAKMDPKDTLSMLVQADMCIMDDSFLEEVVQPCLCQENLSAALTAFYGILQHRAHEVDTTQDPPVFQWFSSEQDNQAVIQMGFMSLNMFSRLTPNPIDDEIDRRKEQLRILQCISRLLYATPYTESGVYGRLLRLLRSSAAVRDAAVLDEIAGVVWQHDINFNVDIKDVIWLLSYLEVLHASSGTQRFLKVSASALRISARIPRVDLVRVRDGIRDALGVVAGYFDPSANELPVQKLTDDGCWGWVSELLDACIDVAHLDSGLVTRGFVDALERYTVQCPHHSWADNLRVRMGRLRASIIVRKSPKRSTTNPSMVDSLAVRPIKQSPGRSLTA